MSAIDAVQAQLRKLYSSANQETIEVPLVLQAAVYCHYARDYLKAASIINEENVDGQMPLLMPWYQLMGQALELSMKACLAVAAVSPPRSHDLVALCKRVEEIPFTFGVEHVHALLVHLNHGYFEDLATGDRFVARYGGGGSLAVPDHARLAAACNNLISQAEERNPALRATP